MVVAVLAVVKAGGGWLPLDPHYPAQRLAHMLRDSGARLVLTQEKLLEPLQPMLAAARDAGHAVEAWRLDAAEAVASGENDADLGVSVHPDNLAHVIYTSGST